jgi:hypothetical protein
MKKKIDRTNIGEHLLDYQLTIIGKSRIDILDDDRWFFNWTLTRSQFEEFTAYAIPLLKKTFKCNKSKAEGMFVWFNTQFGIRIKN